MCYSMVLNKASAHLVDGEWWYVGYKMVVYEHRSGKLFAPMGKKKRRFLCFELPTLKPYEYKFGALHVSFSHGLHVADNPDGCRQYIEPADWVQGSMACVTLFIPETALTSGGHARIAYLPPPSLEKFQFEISKPLDDRRTWYDFRADGLNAYDIKQIRNGCSNPELQRYLQRKIYYKNSANCAAIRAAHAFNSEMNAEQLAPVILSEAEYPQLAEKSITSFMSTIPQKVFVTNEPGTRSLIN